MLVGGGVRGERWREESGKDVPGNMGKEGKTFRATSLHLTVSSSCGIVRLRRWAGGVGILWRWKRWGYGGGDVLVREKRGGE